MKVNTLPAQSAAKADSVLLDLIKRSREISDASGESNSKLIEYVSNSYLTRLEREIQGTPQFFGNEAFLKFGHEFHKRELKPLEKRIKLSKEEEKQLKGMLSSLADYTPWTKFKRGAVLEKVHVVPVFGQACKVILDSEKNGKSKDLKTTSCLTEKDFIKKALYSYNYPSQGVVYSEGRKLKQFDILGICKHKPYPVFEFTVNDFPHEMQEGEDRVRRIIDAYRSLRRLLGLPLSY